jgi:hypothetical protein
MTDRTRKIEDVLREAAAAVAAAELPEELRSVAFGKAVDMLVAAPAPGHETDNKRYGRQDQPSRSDDPLQQIATKLETDIDVIDEIFDHEAGEPKLIISRSKLDSSKKAATKQITLLVVAARQASGVDQWTESKVIREVATDYGKFDRANFAAAVSELEDELSFSGTRRARKVKMRRDGFKRTAALIRQLHGKTDE